MVELKHISKSFYLKDKRKVEVLKDVSVLFPSSSLSFILGKSGSGKTTLLDIVGCLLTPDQGEVYINDHKIDYSSNKSLFNARSNLISFVFQDYNLLEDFTIEDNLQIAGLSSQEEVDSLLKKVGLFEKKGTEVRMLSGGEKQRLAIARALGRNTELILLDEPTGNLDKENSKAVMELLKELCKEKTVIVVTHDEDLVKEYGDFACKLEDGEVKVILDNKREEVAATNPKVNVAKFSLKKQFIYALQLIKKHWIRNLASCLLLILSLTLVLFDMVFVNIDGSEAMYSFMNKINLTQVNVSSVGFSSFSGHTAVYSGEKMNDVLDSKGVTHYNYFNAYVSKLDDPNELTSFDDFYTNPIRVNIVDTNEFCFNNKTYSKPQKGEIVLTSFLNEMLPNDEIHILSSDRGSEFSEDKVTVSLKVEDESLETDVPSSLVQKLRSGEELDEEEKLKVDNLYAQAFISYETYVDCENSYSIFKGYYPAFNDFTKNNLIGTSYLRSENETYLLGNKPSSVEEISLSKRVVDIYFKDEDISSLIGKEVSYSKLEDSSYYEKDASFTSLIDMSKVVPTVKIVGIVDDQNNESIYVTDQFIDRFIPLKENCLDGINVNIESSDQIKALFDSNISFSPVEFIQLDSFYQSSPVMVFMKQVLSVLWIVFILLFLVVVLFTCTISVTEKAKEIAIMKSLGLKKKETYGPFLMQNGIMACLGLIFCFLLSAMILSVINSNIDIAAVETYNFNLLYFNSKAVIITVCLGFALPVLVSLVPLFKIKKVDVAYELKSY